MAHFFSSFTQLLKKFFAPFPHIPNSLLLLFVPILPWYLFLRGLLKSISGLRSLSGSFQLGSLPRIFSEFLQTTPLSLFWDGVLNLFVGLMYFTAFTYLASKKTREKGWNTWVQAAFLLSVTHLYETLLYQRSFFWFVIGTLLNWYLIFEFGRIFLARTQKQERLVKKRTTRKSSKK